VAPLAVIVLLGLLQDASVLLKQGEELLRAGRPLDAERALEEAVKLDPGSSRAQYYLGVARVRLERYEDAIAALEKARELAASPNPAVLYELGNAYLKCERFADAASALAAASRLAPGDGAIRLQLGFAYYKRVEGQRARDEFQRVIEVEPSNGLAHFYLGLSEAALGRIEAAQASFRRALQLRPDLVEARLALAQTLSQAGRYPEAESELRSLLSLLETLPEKSLEAAASAHDELGLIRLRSGDPESAVAHFEAVLAIRPEDRQATYNLSLLYRRLGRMAEAEEMRKRFEASKAEAIEARSLSRTSSKPQK
jgi:tetratricopeptide (TPR) repeat protein